MTKKTNIIKEVINPREEVYKSADTVNYEGFSSWVPNDIDYMEQILMTNTLENTFYVGQADNIKSSVEFLKGNQDSIKHIENFPDVKTLAKLAIKGRNEGYIRTINLVALAIIKQKDPEVFKEVFNQIVLTGGDLLDFIEISKIFGTSGSARRKAITNWLKAKLNPFYALKYGNEIAVGIKLARPSEKDFTPEQNVMVDYLIGNKQQIEYFEKLPKPIMLYESIAHVGKDGSVASETQIINAIKEGRLDYTKIKGIFTKERPITQGIRLALAEQMGTFALLRHLASLERENIFSDVDFRDTALNLIRGRFTVENFKKAKIFPFRIYQAYRMVKDREVRNILADALEQYVPQFNWEVFGRTCVAPDVSGSMSCTISRRSDMTYCGIAAMFSGFLYKGIKNSIVYPFDTDLRTDLVRPRRDSVITHIEHLDTPGGGTFMGVPIKELINRKEKVDTFISITDSMEWGEGWLGYWKQYKKEINPNAVAFLIRIDSYRTNPYSQEDAVKYDIYKICGWNDNVISYILYQLERRRK